MTSVLGYKMTHDSGFAPNPFHGHLTLATCKPALRRARNQGDWVAGFASKALVANARAKGVQIPYMGLVFLMQVTEAPMPLADYFSDPRFARKKPDLASRNRTHRCGDNIYSSDGQGGLRWWPNEHHPESWMPHDISGRNALVSSRFWYLGKKAFAPPEGWSLFLGTKLSDARTFHCPASFLARVQDHFAAAGIGQGVLADPCMWEAQSVGPCVRT